MENVAKPSGLTASSLSHELYEKGYLFEFHAAVKILAAAAYDPKLLSAVNLNLEDKVIIRANPNFSRNATDIDKIEAPSTLASLPEMRINFFGLETRQGPLPDPYVEQILRSLHNKNTALHDFLTIFNTRLGTLLHSIRKKYWVGISVSPPEETFYGKTFMSLVGLDNKFLEKRLSVPDRTLLYYSGLLFQKPRSKLGLQRMLQHFLGVPVALEEFIGGWRFIPKDQATLIGGSKGQFQILGKTAIIGEKFWNQAAYVRIKLGPLNLDQFYSCLKGMKMYEEIQGLVQFYVSKRQDYQLQLVLKKEEVPALCLGKKSYLGWSSWLKTKPFLKDADGVILTKTA